MEKSKKSGIDVRSILETVKAFCNSLEKKKLFSNLMIVTFTRGVKLNEVLDKDTWTNATIFPIIQRTIKDLNVQAEPLKPDTLTLARLVEILPHYHALYMESGKLPFHGMFIDRLPLICQSSGFAALIPIDDEYDPWFIYHIIYKVWYDMYVHSTDKKYKTVKSLVNHALNARESSHINEADRQEFIIKYTPDGVWDSYHIGILIRSFMGASSKDTWEVIKEKLEEAPILTQNTICDVVPL